MKALNKKERIQSLLKFTVAGFAVLGLFGFVLYSTNIVQNDLSDSAGSNKVELEDLEHFVSEANTIVNSYKEVDSQLERNTYALELDKYILDKKSDFKTYSSVFSSFEKHFKELLITHEKLKNANDFQNTDCELKMKELELEILDLKTSSSASGSTNINVKAGLQRTLVELNSLLAAIDGKNFLGMGVKKMRSEIKTSISLIKQDLENQVGMIQ